MRYRRYYPKGSTPKYVLNNTQFNEMVKQIGFEQAIDKDNACIELIPENITEAKEMFNDSCNRILENTRFYLDNLDKIPTFNVKISDLFKYIPLKPKDL